MVWNSPHNNRFFAAARDCVSHFALAEERCYVASEELKCFEIRACLHGGGRGGGPQIGEVTRLGKVTRLSI